MVRIFDHEGIPQPETLVVNTDEDVSKRLRSLGIDTLLGQARRLPNHP